MTSSNSIRSRFRARLKHGLLTQEILDRLAQFGVCFYPYFLVRELPLKRPELSECGEGLYSRFLEPSELIEVSKIPQRPRDLVRLEMRLQNGGCFGVFEAGQLAAYSWYSSEKIPTAIGGHVLCKLPSNTLYLYDAYVRPEFRGRRIAGLMRHQLHEALAQQEVTTFISISLAFNKSSRRFKSKLGAEEFETRLLFSIARLGGLDIRLSRSNKFVDAPRVKFLSHTAAPGKSEKL
ncbi:MAG: GNAT superfamily N-acetyltransferase [Gammaproteobacteria bacterium]|jgi:GNAT superfamily N-acetyltransferase